MSTLTVFAKDLLPWTPDIDSRRSDKPEIITGQNFIDDIDGPRSAWSSNYVNFNYWDVFTRGKINELRLAKGMLYGTQTGVWSIDPVSGLAVPILLISVVNKFWPWTIAYVGGVYYLAQFDVGLWQYNPINNTIAHIVTPFNDLARFVSESKGRLIVLTPDVVVTSALDDGTDLNPSLTTAAGAQSLSLVGGDGYRIESIPDGFLVYLSAGIMKATFTQQAFVFSYDNLTPGIKVFNPNAGVFIPRVGALSLDNSGLNLTREFNYTDLGIPQPWEIEKADYIKKNILAFLDQTSFGTIGMYYSIQMQMLFIFFSANTNPGLFYTTFVWSSVSKKWSSFDIQHYGIFETYDASSNTYACSYMGSDGYMHAFSNANFTQTLPTPPLMLGDFVYRASIEETVIAEINAGGVEYQLGVTEINLTDYNPFTFQNLTGNVGTFQMNFTPYSDTVNDAQDDPPIIIGNPIVGGTYINMDVSGGIELFAIPYVLPQIGLASSLQVGPFRFTDQLYADQTSMVDTISLDLSPTSNFNVFEDWNILNAPAEDWNTLTGSEDWGAGVQTPNSFGLILRSSNDGVNPGEQGDEDLVPFQDLGSSQVFKPSGWSGVYHLMTLKAIDPGQSFALKTIGLTGALTGRLQSL